MCRKGNYLDMTIRCALEHFYVMQPPLIGSSVALSIDQHDLMFFW